METSPVLYVISDSLGETAELVARAALSQFYQGHGQIRRFAHVDRVETIGEVLTRAREDRAIVAFTLVVPELRDCLEETAKTMEVAVVDLLTPLLTAIELQSGLHPRGQAGLVHQLDDDYFRRIDAVEFAVKYDDGKEPKAIALADIVLVGVSRTSKTPLSMYLAHKRFRVMNIPLVPGIRPPDELFRLPNRRKVVGLTIQPEKLNLIRKARLRAMGLQEDAEYASPGRILEELEFADEIMKRLGCPVIDVSDKAVEETAGQIIELILEGGRDHEKMGVPL